MTTIDLLVKRLAQKYSPTIALNFSNPWELLVAVILSAQCTDVMVNRVTANLFKKYKTLEDYCRADISEFEKDIHSTGFYKNKAQNILKTALLIKEKYNGKIPSSMTELLTLHGVARKTANVILSTIYNKHEGIVVDTHVKRISQRLRLVPLEVIGGKQVITFIKDGKKIIDYTKDAYPEKIESELMKAVPKDYWGVLPHLLIKLGRDVCKAPNPKCKDCIIQELCPVSRVSNLSI